jgi:anti-anti-sigma factor
VAVHAPDIPVLVPGAELNRDTLEALKLEIEPLLNAEQPGPGLIIDMGDVTFINSTALGYVVWVGKELAEKGRRIALARPQRKVEKLLRMVGLSSMLPHFKSVHDAERHVGAAPMNT